MNNVKIYDRAGAAVGRSSGAIHKVTLSDRNFFTVEHRDGNGVLKGKPDIVYNTVCDAAQEDLLNVYFHQGTVTATWYIGLINGAAPTVATTDTHTTHAGWTESTAYDEAARQAWVEDAASSGATPSITNSAAAVFTMNATATIGGMFLASIVTKGSTGAGILWGGGAFTGGDKAVVDNDTLSITYTVTW